jgi:multidrug efflux system outer membrane protein
VSCAVGPNYQRPKVNLPPDFRGSTQSTTNSFGDLPWWEVFHDETLQGLIRTVLTNGYDIRLAVSRVEQANAILAQNRASFFPQFNYVGLLGRGKNAIGGTLFPNGGNTISDVEMAGNASWEIDVWGRIRRLNESARAQYLATVEARHDVMVSVISEVAQAYFQLLALDRELEIARYTTNSFGESLRIFSARLQGGVASKLETSSAEAALASAAATVPELERQIAIQENFLSTLIGREPGPIPRSHTLLQELLPPEIPAGLPSALLERRPDIREAAQLYRSANAQIGLAVAQFFPQFNLTAAFGRISPALSTFTAGTASAWSVAGGFTGPIFEGGRLVGQYRQAVALRQQYWLSYQQIVLNALQEVSNTLIANSAYAAERVQQARAVAAYEVSVQVATQRYVVGQSSYYEVLQEQQLLFPAENTLVQIQLSQLLTIVQFYRALGGGWQVDQSSHATTKNP